MSRIVHDPVIAEYVNRIGQNLSGIRREGSVHHKGGRLEEVNASALPGGFLL